MSDDKKLRPAETAAGTMEWCQNGWANPDWARHAALSSLPLDILEVIGCLLEVKDRVALASCCRSLWARPDLAASAALWGDLQLDVPHTRQAGPLAAWLARRRSGLRRLRLAGSASAAQPLPELLDSLSSHSGSTGSTSSSSALPSSPLAELGLSFNLGADCDQALAPLECLPSLTALNLSSCKLRALPASLGTRGLLRLAALDLQSNPALGMGAEANLQPLANLSSLRSLDLRRCSLCSVPPALSALRGLQDLDLSFNCVGRGGEGACQPLRHVTSLTRLALVACSLRALPAQLSALKGLRDLAVDRNEALGAGRMGTFAPLAELTALTRLGLRACLLNKLPQHVAALSAALRCLQLGWNPLSHWDGEPLASLRALSSITCLELSYCGLQRLPPEMSRLRGLSDLDISGTGPLDAAGALAPLEALSALTRLDVRHCKLGGDLPQLLALQAAGVLVVSDALQAAM